MSEMWLIEKARKSKDPFESQSWMLMAKTMLPSGSYELCISTYELYFEKRNAAEAADTLQKLYMKYSSDPRFWEEASKLARAIEPKVESPETTFRREVFQKLLPELQQSLLLDLADRSKDTEEKCRIYLLCLRMFKDSLAAFGIELIRILRELQNKNVGRDSGQNWYQEVLVTKVVPALLKFCDLPMSEELCVGLLNESILFHSLSALSSLNQEKKVDAELEHLGQLIRLAGERFDWIQAKGFPSFKLEEMRSFLKKVRTGDRERKRTETHYSALVTLAWLLTKYLHHTSAERDSVLLLMPPDVRSMTDIDALGQPGSPPQAKKSKEDYPLASPGDSVDSLKDILSVALSCWELLVSKKGLIREVFGVELNSKVREMLTDAMIFERQFEECAAVIEKSLETERKEVKGLFKLSSCCLALRRHQDAKRFAAEAIGELGTVELNPEIPPTPPGRSMLYMNLDECLQFMCRLFFNCNAHSLNSKDPADPNGRMIGDVMVLSQAYWPHYKPLFRRAVEIVEHKGSFTYPNFFNYIKNLSMLEEFSYITERKPKITLNITDTEAGRKPGLSTRHSVKGAKDEIRQLLEIGAKSYKPSVILGEVKRFFVETYRVD